jgi:cobyric acid synthase
LGFTHVNDTLGIITKDAKVLINVDVDRGGLNAVVAGGLNNESALLQRLFDGPIREHH